MLAIRCMQLLANVYEDLGQRAASRSAGEEMMEAVRSAGAEVDVQLRVQSRCHFGGQLATIGEVQAGIALKEEGLGLARRVLGEAHPYTQQEAKYLALYRDEVTERCSRGLPADLLAFGTVLGLRARPELNDACAWVVGFGDGRYRVRLGNADDTVRRGPLPCARSDTYMTLGIKPANLLPVPGLQLVVVMTFLMSHLKG